MQLRHAVVATLAVVALGPIVPAEANFRSADSTPSRSEISRLPRPERSPDAERRDHDPHSVLVRFERGASTAAKARALKGSGATLAGAVAGTSFVKARTAGKAADALRTLMRDPSVDTASLDYRRKAAATPNDPLYRGYQTYLGTARLPQAWDRIRDARTQVIAVVDTGVDTLHPDLTGRTTPGYNAITPGAAPTDDHLYSHGTFVAGVAAANTNNGVGIAGVAWAGQIMPVKVLNKDGVGTDSDVVEGITWAVDHGAKIVNLSLGGPADSPALRQAVQYATSKGALVVAAAGNWGDNTPQYPAAYPEVLAVGATDRSGALTDFSSWGDWIDVAAPGFEIVSTIRRAAGYYASGDGTSFSAPIASGVAALVRAKYPTLTPAQVISRLRATARDAGPRGIDPYYGYGVLDAFYAVGGTWGPEFPQRALGAGEPNDVPARATALSTAAAGTTAMEGDLDWYRYESVAQQDVTVRVTPPPYDPARAQNFDPVLEVYDSQLRLLGRVDDPENPAAEEKLDLTVLAGAYYVAVRNFNGAADTRAHTVAIDPGPVSGPAPTGEQLWVRDVAPADFATGMAATAAPSVSFQRALDPASVDGTTVSLIHGRTGATLPTTLSYDLPTNTVTLTPATPLQDNTPYRILVGAVRDQAGATPTERFSATFRTADLAPPEVGNFTATGAYAAATLTWTRPNITDLDQVIVRMAAGATPPSSPTTGVGVYAGVGTSVRVTGLPSGTTYSFRVWVKDRSGMLSTAPSAQLVGTALAVSSSTTAVTYGGAVTVTGRLVRPDTGAAVAGAPVQLYGRRKGTSTWQLLGTATSSSTGFLSFGHKPSWSLDYLWRYDGSTAYLWAASAPRLVQVRPVVTATLSKTSFPLGGSVTLSGSVAPNHAGQVVYLQRLASGRWTNVASRVLSSTSAYKATLKPSARGTYTYRVYKPADSDHLAAVSPARSFTVT
jgi:type VII secretion-associated serine protease mycosin